MRQGGHSPGQGAEASIVWSWGHSWSAVLLPGAGAGRKGWKKNPEEGGWQEVVGLGEGRMTLEQAGLKSP